MKLKLILCCFTLVFFSCNSKISTNPHALHGKAFGTTFSITYFGGDLAEDRVADSIYARFDRLNQSLSTYIEGSDISKINQGDSNVVVDAYFTEVFEKSKKIYRETKGVFDPTIGALVNAWGFGPNSAKQKVDSLYLDALRAKIGFNKVSLRNGKVVQEQPVYFDFNALAKGYALDLAGRYLEAHRITNYLIEIGGEIRARGKHLGKDKAWTVAIEKPNFDGTRSIDKVIHLTNQSMATSGGYRKFNIDSLTGNKYIHIIDPQTGYPSQSNLLSVSIIAALDCADVDGYATALLAMGLADAKMFLSERPDLIGVLVYSDETGNLKHFLSSNFEGLNDSF